jgi:hypothetical protein
MIVLEPLTPHERQLLREAYASAAAQARRCGNCKHWRPLKERDEIMDRHYGTCVAPLPKKVPACMERSMGERWATAHDAGTDCGAWKKGGKHGDLR